MAQSMTTTSISRVNRRFLLLALILGSLFAVLAYALLSNSGSGGGGAAVGEVPVVVAKAAIPAGTVITADMVAVQQLPADKLPLGVFESTDLVIGRVTRYPLAANEQVLLSKLVGGADTATSEGVSVVVQEGQRGMAIKLEQVVGYGGLVLPGDYVDVLWLSNEVVAEFEGAGLIAENVEVLAVQQTIVDLPPSAPGLQAEGEEPEPLAPGEHRVRGSDAEPIPESITVTLMLTPEQTARVFCAEERGILRLTVRAFGDASPSGVPAATCVLRVEEE